MGISKVKKSKNKMPVKVSMVKKIVYPAVVICVLLMTFSVGYLLNASSYDLREVALINNDSVTVDEFRQQILEKRGDVISYFQTKYGIEVGSNFWTEEYGGEVPSEVVKERAFTEVKRMRVQLQMAKKEGLIEDISFESILREMKNENKQRKEAIAKNQVIYGLKEFKIETYMNYLLSGLSKDLKSKLSKYWDISDDDLRKKYEDIKDVHYVKGRSVKVNEIKLSYVDDNGTVDIKMKEELEKNIKEAKRRISEGESFEDVARDVNSEKFDSIRTFDEETARVDATVNPVLREIVNGMKQGEISDIIEEGNAFYIVKCIDNRSLGYIPFEEVKENLQSRYVDEKYEEFVNKQADEADVQIFRDVYRKIRTDK